MTRTNREMVQIFLPIRLSFFSFASLRSDLLPHEIWDGSNRFFKVPLRSMATTSLPLPLLQNSGMLSREQFAYHFAFVTSLPAKLRIHNHGMGAKSRSNLQFIKIPQTSNLTC